MDAGRRHETPRSGAADLASRCTASPASACMHQFPLPQKYCEGDVGGGLAGYHTHSGFVLELRDEQ